MHCADFQRKKASSGFPALEGTPLTPLWLRVYKVWSERFFGANEVTETRWSALT